MRHAGTAAAVVMLAGAGALVGVALSASSWLMLAGVATAAALLAVVLMTQARGPNAGLTVLLVSAVIVPLEVPVGHRVFNAAVLAAPVTGRIALSIPGTGRVERTVPGLEHSLDYLGLNYYTRWRVRALSRVPRVARAPRGARPETARSDLGWEVGPAGLAAAARRAAGTGAPVLVTEHGLADAADAVRPRALVESLLGLGRAIAAGTPVLGYLHWSLMDNFEWAEGFAGRFGLGHVDFTDPGRPRTPRRSAAVLARIARANAITAELAREVGADPAAGAAGGGPRGPLSAPGCVR